LNLRCPDPAAESLLRLLAGQALSRAGGAPLVSGNSARILKDAGEHYPVWLSAIGTARRTVFLENYIFADDEVGRELVAALAARVREGVRVRVIYHSGPSGHIDIVQRAIGGHAPGRHCKETPSARCTSSRRAASAAGEAASITSFATGSVCEARRLNHQSGILMTGVGLEVLWPQRRARCDDSPARRLERRAPQAASVRLTGMARVQNASDRKHYGLFAAARQGRSREAGPGERSQLLDSRTPGRIAVDPGQGRGWPGCHAGMAIPTKENDMLASKWILRLVAVAAIGALSACAAPGGISAEPHQHLRDAKQGPALSYAPTPAAAPVLFHDHREMK
jgi:hypothetical protein